MTFIYMIICVYRSPDLQERGNFSNMCFRTEDEAERFCKDNDDPNSMYSWRKITLGKYPKRKKK